MYLQIIDIHKHYYTNSDKNKQWQPYELSCSHHPYIYKRTALYYSTAGDKPSQSASEVIIGAVESGVEYTNLDNPFMR
jgi:hypothetical protein